MHKKELIRAQDFGDLVKNLPPEDYVTNVSSIPNRKLPNKGEELDKDKVIASFNKMVDYCLSIN